MPSIAPYANAGGDGSVYNDVAASWSTARNAATGTLAYPADDQATVYTGPWGGTQYFRRAFLPHDTSAIPDNNEATAGALYIYVTGKGESGMSSSICVVASTQASDTGLTTADFDACGTVELTARRAISDLTVGAYNAFTLTVAGRAAINKGGFTKLCLRTAHDLDNTEVTGNKYSYVNFYTSDRTGTTQDPYLEITYAEVQRAGGDTLGWSDGTGQALDKADGSKQRWGSDVLAWQDSPPVYWRAARKVITVTEAGANTDLNGGHTFPQSTVTVLSTAGFPDSGTAYVVDTTTPPYPETSFTYTGKTATTFTGCSGGSGTFASGKSVSVANAENFFPMLNVSPGSNPELLTTYVSKSAHSGTAGSTIRGKKSVNGGLTWGTEGVILASNVNGAGWGIGGHNLIRLADSSHIATWYEGTFSDRTKCRSYSMRCAAGLDPLNPANWDSPVAIPGSLFGLGDYIAVGITGILEYGGNVYVTAYGIDSGRADDNPQHHYSKLLKTTDKGATTGNWSVQGTIATTTQTDGRANGEASLAILPDGTWLSHLRCEVTATYTTLDRYQAKSTDNGATWTGHTRIAQNLVNSSSTLRRQTGMLISQGGSASGTPPKTIFTADYNDWSGPSSGTRTEPVQNPYVFYVGSDFKAVPPSGPFDAVNVFALEDGTQSGAAVFYQWYELPDQRYGSDALIWTDTASRTTAVGKTGADTLAWTDGATGVRPPFDRSGADALTWTDTAAGSAAFERTGADSLTWTDAGAQAGVFARTGADALAWADGASAPLVVTRTGGDSLTWTDTGTRTSGVKQRTGADALTWTDTASAGGGGERTGADSLTWSDAAARSFTPTRTGADSLSWQDGGLRGLSVTRPVFDTITWQDSGSVGVFFAVGADTLTWSDGAAGAVTNAPTAPYTLTGTSRRHASAAGTSRGHARLTGGTTP